MIESVLPKWNARLDAYRPSSNPGFHDLVPLVNQHFRLHERATNFLGPYNAKQRGKDHYLPPTREQLKELIPQGRVNDFSYLTFINSLIRFCETTRGTRALPTPHPSVIHSIQLPRPAFDLKAISPSETEVQVIGAESSLFVRGLRNPGMMKFIIVRPRLSKLGTASATNWEVLFYQDAVGYIPEWTDTQLNPRWAGTL